MKWVTWVTRDHMKLDRVVCPWLSRRSIRPGAEFLFVSVDTVRKVAERKNAT